MKFDSKVILHAGWEMLLMRIGFAWIVWGSIPAFEPYTMQPRPNGLAHLVDLTFLCHPEIMGPLRGVLAIALIFYILRILTFPALTIMAAMLIACGSLENSQGAINHTFQVVALVALGQWLVSGWGLLTQYLRKSFEVVDSLDSQRLIVHAAKVALVACYFASAFTKMQQSDGMWILRTPNLASAIVKSNANSYLNTLTLPDQFSANAPEFIAHHPYLTMTFIGGGFLLELFAFLALLGRWQAFVIGIAVITMHSVIAGVMHLHFQTFQQIAFFFLVNAPFVAFWLGSICWRRAVTWTRAS